MSKKLAHSFHIPVMGLGFTIDTPIKVAHLGISSVISIMDDHLVEEMREVHAKANGREFSPILKTEADYRAKRIQAYLNLVNDLVNEKMESMRHQSWEAGTDLYRYFELLPETSLLKQTYLSWLLTKDESVENYLRESIIPGSIDVNIMSKVNKTNYSKDGEALEKEFADALSALRGYAMSNLQSSVIFSAGYNPLLYSYIEQFEDFFPNAQGALKKQIILKVSDFRSALTQGKLLAKKGLWISEFRIESGLNCGGHAFATDGLLLGPILEEFKSSRNDMKQELFDMCHKVLTEKGGLNYSEIPEMRITVQGGIGTSEENEFLLDHYQTQGTGWGSPFLLVPEATNVDEATLNALATAEESDYYMSHASPLGVPFNNFRKSSSEKQRLERIEKGRPGSPCNLEYLSTNTEFTEKPICTASRQYQHAKIKELEAQNLPKNEFRTLFDKITEKACLCTGLGTSVLKNHGIKPKHHLNSIAICPGPNLAYFSGVYSLKEMVDHIYGRINILNTNNRPNLFVKELGLYVDYLKNELAESVENMNVKQERYLKTFKQNLLAGVEYYKSLPFPNWNDMLPDLKQMESRIEALVIPSLERNMA
ncbi:hypothetical protein [Aquirufa aurantiipilula]